MHPALADAVAELMLRIEMMVQDMKGDYPDVDEGELEYEAMKIVVREATSRKAAAEVARSFGYQMGR